MINHEVYGVLVYLGWKGEFIMIIVIGIVISFIMMVV